MQNSNSIEVRKYSSQEKFLWKEFAALAKNSHFMFSRVFMEYHRDRFKDHSLIFLRNNQPAALLPANVESDTLCSHRGLSFAGFITKSNMTTTLMLDLFQALKRHARRVGINKIIYKVIPHMYHQFPAEEDRYALFRNGAKLIACQVNSVVDFRNECKWQNRRNRSLKKARKFDLLVSESSDYVQYWDLLNTVLQQRHQASPVHTLDEITRLSVLFAGSIRLHLVHTHESMLLAGIVTFETRTAVHCQYIACSDKGRETGALDLLFHDLLARYRKLKYYFDFGTSNEKDGHYVNKGLIDFKEGFGARTVVHNTYELDLASND